MSVSWENTLAIAGCLFGTADGTCRRTWAWATFILVPVFFIGGQILFLLPAKLLGWINRENVETYPHVLNLIIGAFAVCAFWVGVVGNSVLFTLMHFDSEARSRFGLAGIAILTSATRKAVS